MHLLRETQTRVLGDVVDLRAVDCDLAGSPSAPASPEQAKQRAPSPSPSPPFAGGEGILVRGERSLRATEARIADCRLKANSP